MTSSASTAGTPARARPSDIIRLAPNVLSVKHWDRLLGGLLYAGSPRDEHEVVTAADGLEGLAIALADPHPDVVIAEPWMPRLDGVTMVQRMKQNEAVRRVPVIFLSGQTSVQSVIAGIAAGARAYLFKPVNPDILARKVQSALASGFWRHPRCSGEYPRGSFDPTLRSK